MFRLFKALFIITCILIAIWSSPADAQERARVMLVLDASGSMWAKVDGRPKIEIARDVIADLMQDWDESVDLGLSAYGHRRKGDCEDIQTLRKVGPAQPQAIVRIVNKLSPKGKTPLTEAVRRAAEEMRFTEERATVILLSDGIETCDADPCAVGKELAKAGVDFTTHVIGFDLKKEEQESLRCLAENTGGKFLAADNATTLLDALETTVTQVKQETVKVAEKPKPPEKTEPKPAGKPGHRFVALYAAGGPEVKKDMRWDVYEAKTDEDGNRKHISGNYDTKPRFELNKGRYVVVAKRGNATASKEFDVDSVEDRKRHEIVLDAGLVKLSAVLAEGGDPVAKDMRWDVFESATDEDGKRKHINGNYDAAPTFALNTGTYFVVAKNGNAVVNGEVKIEPGKRKEQQFILNAGLAVLEASYDESGTPINKDMRWDVYSAEKDLDGNRKHINGNYDAKPKFILPAGKYHVVAKRGSATVGREIEVEAGKRKDELFVLNAGLVKFSAVFAEGKDPITKGMRWDVYGVEKDLEGKRKHFAGGYDAQPIYALPDGKYFVVAKHGSAVKSGEIEVKAGKRSEPIFNLDAGQIKLVAMPQSGQPLTKGLRWDVFGLEKDLEGNRKHFAGSYDATPIYTLAAGKYLVIVKAGDAKAEYELTVTAGDSKQVDIPFN